MNSLNPNIKEALLASTDFTDTQIRITFDLLKMIEKDSHRKFVLTEEKFILFVERCRDRRWPCDQVASKLSARVKLVEAQEKWSGSFYAQSDDIKFNFNAEDLRNFMGGST